MFIIYFSVTFFLFCLSECGMKNRQLDVVCDSCGLVLPSGKCVDCSTLYCNVCFKSYHKNQSYPEYKEHTMEMLDEETQAAVDEITRLRDEERYSHL